MSATIRSFEVGEYDDRNRLRCATVPNPAWEQFLDAFRAVQQRERRLASITLTAEDGSSLTIDGSDGLFFALYERADRLQFQPLDTSQPDDEVAIICGGVNTTLPRSGLLDEVTLLRAIGDFWRGQLDVSIGWEPL